jgi:DNA replication protein
MIEEAIDFRTLLLENYKKIGINENQLAVLLMIEHLLKLNNVFITTDMLSLKMNLSVEVIDQTLVSLLEKKWIEYDNVQQQMRTTLNPLKRKLYQEFQFMVLHANEQKEGAANESLGQLYRHFEQELARPLSPLERARIGEWLSFGYAETLIKKALNEALGMQKKSLRAVDKILLKYTLKEDVEKEGVSAVNSQWEQNIQKTLEIAQTKWVDDDEE